MTGNPMNIADIGKLSPTTDLKLSKDDRTDHQGKFSGIFAQAMGFANDSLCNAGIENEKLITGTLPSTHELAVAGCKAEMMIHLTTQVANKLTACTTQLFQMQI